MFTQHTLQLIDLFRRRVGMRSSDDFQMPDPSLISTDKHLGFLREEISEMEEAFAAEDPIGVLDAVCDLQVFLDHLVHDVGLQHLFGPAFLEVMGSNFSKGDADGNYFNDDGKLIKGPHYFKPDLRRLFHGPTEVHFGLVLAKERPGSAYGYPDWVADYFLGALPKVNPWPDADMVPRTSGHFTANLMVDVIWHPSMLVVDAPYLEVRPELLTLKSWGGREILFTDRWHTTHG